MVERIGMPGHRVRSGLVRISVSIVAFRGKNFELAVSRHLTNRKAQPKSPLHMTSNLSKESCARLATDLNRAIRSRPATRRDREGRDLCANLPVPSSAIPMGQCQNGEVRVRGPYALARLVGLTNVHTGRNFPMIHLSRSFPVTNLANFASSSASSLAMVCRFEASVSLRNKSR